jgi:class 3 adenylate cyclase/tetratricopeptide (TPR) repeat protein
VSEPQQEKTPPARQQGDWKNHPVLKVAGAYCVGAWLILQVAEVVLPSYDIPDTVMQVLINVLVALFPVVLLAARFTRVSKLVTTERGASEQLEQPLPLIDGPVDIADTEPSALDIPIALSERRTITTVACSLTGLRSGRNDPEVLLGIIPAVEEQVSALIDRYEGFRLASSRNEIVVAFGYPSIHEDDARRAAKVGQTILTLLSEQKADIPDAAIFGRAGIHTDTIIVDDDDEDEDEIALLGDNTAVVEWLQALAPQGGIAVSAESARLLVDVFDLEELSRESHPRLGQDVPVFSLGPELPGQWQQVMEEVGELFGREHEYQLLLDHWRTALEGESQFVLLEGEAGIGKSSLLYRTVREIVESDGPQLIILNCESYFRDSPFRPIISYLENRVYGGDFTLSRALRLERLRDFIEGLPVDIDETLPLLASLLSLEAEDDSLQLNESGRLFRERTIRCVVDLLQALAKTQPILLAVEDLHWADPSTIELFDHLLSDVPEHRIYGLFSSRPDFIARWSNLSHVFTVHLGKLPDRVAEQLIRKKFGERDIPDWLVAKLVLESGGIPFFLEELVRSLMGSEKSLVTADPESLEIPPSLQASLDARVGNLGLNKPLLQLCSVLGQEFHFELLREVVQADEGPTLLTALGSLVNEGFLYQKGVAPDASFRFKHRLIMESAYQSLLVKTRAELHGTIAESIERSFPSLCETAPGRLAQHFDRSGNASRALHYRIFAAQRAQRSFANDEALAHIARGEELLSQLDEDGKRNETELVLKNLQGMILLSSRGYTNPEVRVAFERAIELSEKLDNSPELFATIVGLWMYYLIKAEYSQAMEIAQRLLAMAQDSGDAPELLQANYCIGYSCYFKGHIQQSVESFRVAISHDIADLDYTRQTPSRDDSRVHAYCMLALSLWLTGAPDESRQAMDHAIQIAVKGDQPYAKMWAHYQNTFLCHMRRDFEVMSEQAECMREIATQKGFFFFIPLAEFFQATCIEDPTERLQALQDSHEMIKAAGARSSTSYMKMVIIEELIDQGKMDEARSLLDETREFMETKQEELFKPEYLRLKARLLSASESTDHPKEVTDFLTQSISFSREMGNAPMALRSALALYEATAHSADSLSLLSQVVDSYQSADNTDEFMLASGITAADS